ncbi:Arc family DNA-binding protein [Acinetobacter beijerinckii]|jgi:predicted DNA-binding protein|uniref:Arc family DNA-binding protein n=1 Tax=Acinetobacter beijerinckii TaxID=262668 RepID=UPI003AF96E6E
MARTDQQFPLRLPPELKEKLEDAAKQSGRSKNAEAVYRLEQSFEIDNENLSPLPEKTIHEITNILSNNMMKVMLKLQDLGVSNEITQKAFSTLDEEQNLK